MTVGERIHHHRRSLLFLMTVTVVAGAASLLGLPVALFPQVDFPRVAVSVDAGDRPASQMEMEVTRPAEQALRAVPGVRDIRSTTSRGSADVSVTFAWGADMNLAQLRAQGAMAQLATTLPPGTTFTVRRMDPTVFPVLAFSLTAATLDPIRLREVAEYQLAPMLSAVPGVARIGVQGGEREEIRVEVDPQRLRAHGLALADVATALATANVLTAIGRMEDHDHLYLLLADTRFHSVEDVRHTVVRSGADGVVELEDIATVGRAAVPEWQRVEADGKPAVLLQVYQQRDANTVQLGVELQARLRAAQTGLPAGLVIKPWYDQGLLVSQAAASVRDAILIGSGLAVLVLFLFLRSWKITLVAMVIVPSVLAATALMLSVLGMSLNIMTLGGAAAAVGLIIDDTIVMVEQVMRGLRGGEGAYRHRMLNAASAFMTPLAGSSASTIVIFLPLAFVTGVTGAFFKALSLTMASALVFSFLVAAFVVPLLADHLLGPADAEREEGGPLWDRVLAIYRRVLAALLDRPVLALAGVLPLAILGVLAFTQVGSGFMPAMDEGGFILDYVTPPGTSLAETDRVLRQVDAILHTMPEVDTWSRRTGLQLGGGLTEPNTGDFFVRLKPPPRRDIEAVMADLRARIQHSVPGIDVETAQLMEDMIGDLTAVPQPIEVKLFGEDLHVLQDLAPKVAAAVGKVAGVVEVRDGVVLAGDAVDVEVDRTRAALEGATPQSVAQQAGDYLEGVVPARMRQGVKMVGIRVWTPPGGRATIEDIGRLPIVAADGHVFPLARVATLGVVTGQPEITRENLTPMVAVTARIEGRSMGAAAAEVERTLRASTLIPKSVTMEMGGLYHQQTLAMRDLAIVFVAAVALVFLLLLFLYERYRLALATVAMPLLAVAAVFVGLWVTGTERNITAMMGLTMIVGIVTEIAIFYVSEYQSLLEDGLEARDALVEAGVNRLRPIAMTTIAAILALAPLSLGLGQGSGMLKPLAIAIIAGLAVQVPLVLWGMPVAIAVLERLRGHRKR